MTRTLPKNRTRVAEDRSKELILRLLPISWDGLSSCVGLQCQNALRAGFEPATYGFLYCTASTVHRSTN